MRAPWITLPAPTPIPGGNQIPGGPFLHVFLPGPPEVTLPFTGTQLQGLDTEPAVITDYRGDAFRPGESSLLATNGRIHQAMKKVLADATAGNR